MPLFDFKCEECGHTEEVLMTPEEASHVHTIGCPSCRRGVAERLMGASSIKIKGLSAGNGYGLKYVDT